MPKFIHVGFNFKSSPIPEVELEELFNTSLDWMRYAPNCWVLWTKAEPAEWHTSIKKKCPGLTYFICELNMENRQGWLSKTTWDWIKKDRDPE